MDRSAKHSEVQFTNQTNFLPSKRLIICFTGLSLCSLITQLDTVITATSLQTIWAAFNANPVVSWVPAACLLTSTTFSPLCQRFNDIFGRKLTFSMALLILVIGNLAASFSRSIIGVTVWRGVAGVEGGAIHDLAQSYQTSSVFVRGRRRLPFTMTGIVYREKDQASIMTVVTIGLDVGPVIGSVKLKLNGRASDLPHSMSMLIIRGVTFPWSSPIVIGTLIEGLSTCIISVVRERLGARLSTVLMCIFKQSTVCSVYIASFISIERGQLTYLMGMISFSRIFYLPQFFQVALGYSPIKARAFFIVTLVTQVILSQILAGYNLFSSPPQTSSAHRDNS
ncbi:hypothetical protein AN958_09305 [Leucoagaricus sp. SymC.cos]|nr:hypothetical protein AN958_09305 [Leucoagaricus sp. SymC.cos]